MAAGMNLLALLLATLMIGGGALASVSASSMLLLDPNDARNNRCRVFKSYDLLQAQCKDLKLNDVPKTLMSSIEVLDIRENRIRELRNDTLSKYTSLRYLYVQDNFVQHVAEDAFVPTYYLEVLDLSKNGLLELPPSVFQLQALRNLYLSDNQLSDAVFNVSEVRSPLQWLHLSRNKLTRIPQLKPLATVSVLNVSYNYIGRVSTEDIAPLCSLQVLDLQGNPIKFNDSSCECYEFKEWIAFRKIKLKYQLSCPTQMAQRCLGVEFSNRTMTLYGGCVTNLRERAEARKARSTWIWIASCVGVFVCCIFLLLGCMHKRNKNKRQRLKEQEIHAAPDNPNTEQLLNKDINHEQS